MEMASLFAIHAGYDILTSEVSHVVQVRAEGPKAPSPGHRPGYNGNQQGAL